MGDRIQNKVNGVLRSKDLERPVVKNGIDKTPLFPTPNSQHPRENEMIVLQDRMDKWMLHQPRIDLQCFQGEDPRTWIRKCNRFFLINQVNGSLKVGYIELFLEGKTDVWFQSYKMVKDCVSWSDFCDALTKLFGKKKGV